MAAEEIGVEAESLNDPNNWKEQLTDLSRSYAEYLVVDLTNEKAQVNESTDELLTKLEEFLAVVELARTDSVACLDHTLPKIVSKYEELQQVFGNIDNLEVLVNHVKEKVDKLNEMVTEAEKRLMPESSISKLLSPLFTRKDSNRGANIRSASGSNNFQNPVIFKANDYFPSTSENDHL